MGEPRAVTVAEIAEAMDPAIAVVAAALGESPEAWRGAMVTLIWLQSGIEDDTDGEWVKVIVLMAANLLADHPGAQAALAYIQQQMLLDEGRTDL